MPTEITIRSPPIQLIYLALYFGVYVFIKFGIFSCVHVCMCVQVPMPPDLLEKAWGVSTCFCRDATMREFVHQIKEQNSKVSFPPLKTRLSKLMVPP